jgi:ABC-2 type transport system ATP-binding protein
MFAIQVQNLYKSFGEIQAVQGVSFDVMQGEIFSLIGPNGAGKTTTISMLATLLRPDQGDAFVMGKSVRSDPMGVKAVLGIVPQEIALYEDLSARENLTFWGKMYGLRGAVLKTRVNEVLEIIGLTDRAGGRVSKFSGGMKRRVNIGVALLHKPQVIYMDEPTRHRSAVPAQHPDSVVALRPV